MSETGEGALLGLPESETDLDVNLNYPSKSNIGFQIFFRFYIAEFNRI